MNQKRPIQEYRCCLERPIQESHCFTLLEAGGRRERERVGRGGGGGGGGGGEK